MLSGEHLLEEIADLHRETRELLTQARNGGDVRTALAAVREGRENVVAYSRLGPEAELAARIKSLEDQIAQQTRRVDDALDPTADE